MRFECTHCGQHLLAQPHQAGATATCPSCGHKVVIPKPQMKLVVPGASGGSQQSAAPTGAATMNLAPSKAAPNANLSASPPAAGKTAPNRAPEVSSSRPPTTESKQAFYAFFLGVAATMLFYMALTPIAKSPFAQVMANRGWVVYAETFFLFWALAILGFKWLRLRTERRALMLDVLPVSIGSDILPDNVVDFLAHIDNLPPKYAGSVMVRRLRQGLEHFRARGSHPEVANLMNTQSDLDAGAVSGGYTNIKVFLWAIPILGFIGTVIGISDAIAGFSVGTGGASDMGALTESINKVTGGLGVAFDTTYVALVMSLILSFPSANLQRAEEDLVGAVDSYVLENFLLRLRDEGGLSDIAGSTGALANALAPLLSDSHQDLLLELRRLQEKMLDTQKQQLELFERTKDAVQKQADGVDTRMRGLVESLQSEASRTLGRAADDMAKTLGTLSQGLGGLNSVLKDLGAKQVVIQTTKKKGWFS